MQDIKDYAGGQAKEYKGSLLGKLSSIPTVAITTAFWLSVAMHGQLPGCYILDDWKLRSVVLQMKEIPKSHSAISVAEALQAVAAR